MIEDPNKWTYPETWRKYREDLDRIKQQEEQAKRIEESLARAFNEMPRTKTSHELKIDRLTAELAKAHERIKALEAKVVEYVLAR